jgi:hypothetical protein
MGCVGEVTHGMEEANKSALDSRCLCLPLCEYMISLFLKSSRKALRPRSATRSRSTWAKNTWVDRQSTWEAS